MPSEHAGPPFGSLHQVPCFCSGGSFSDLPLVPTQAPSGAGQRPSWSRRPVLRASRHSNTCGALGGFVGPYLIGALSQRGSYATPCWPSACSISSPAASCWVRACFGLCLWACHSSACGRTEHSFCICQSLPSPRGCRASLHASSCQLPRACPGAGVPSCDAANVLCHAQSSGRKTSGRARDGRHGLVPHQAPLAAKEGSSGASQPAQGGKPAPVRPLEYELER